jgi:hypothetical protein
MSTMAATLRDSLLERRFRFAEHGTTLARDTMAGLTTFIVMSYIIALNPLILTSIKDHTGYALPFGAVLTSTCMVAGVMSILMGLYTNRAYAIAPGMGLNAVVTFGLVGQAGVTWPEAMGIVVLEGVAVTLLVVSGVREAIMKAIAIGIGLFIAFIGLYKSHEERRTLPPVLPRGRRPPPVAVNIPRRASTRHRGFPYRRSCRTSSWSPAPIRSSSAASPRVTATATLR